MTPDTTLPELKNTLRRAALARRDGLGMAERIDASLRIADGVLVEPLPATAGIVGGYLPIRSEVDPRPLMAALADRRLRLCVPAIVGSMLEFRVLERGAPLEPQGHGTLAPGREAPVLVPDVLLVPMAAFDRRGHRLGYGGGFYDRTLAALGEAGRRPVMIGLAFAAQEIKRVPEEPFDVPLDAIVTEAGTIRPR